MGKPRQGANDFNLLLFIFLNIFLCFPHRSDTFEKFLKSRRKPAGPPHTIAQKMRSDNIHMPTFQIAEFSPVHTQRPKTEPEIVVARFNNVTSTPTGSYTR